MKGFRPGKAPLKVIESTVGAEALRREAIDDALPDDDFSGVVTEIAPTAQDVGGVIAYPTEAVWGLGCDPLNPDAVYRLLAMKRRPVDKGLILISDSYEHLEPFLAPTPMVQADDPRGRVDELHLQPLAPAQVAASEAMALLQDFWHHQVLRLGGEAEIDEAGPGDLDAGHELRVRQGADDQLGDLPRTRRGALGQAAHLLGDDGEGTTVLPRLRRDDRRVQREQVRLERDLVDDAADLADPARRCVDLVHRGHRIADHLATALCRCARRGGDLVEAERRRAGRRAFHRR